MRPMLTALPLDIDLDPVSSGPNDFQMAIAILVLVAVVLVTALVVRFLESRILDEEEAEHAREVTSGLRSRGWETLRIQAGEEVAGYWEDVRAMFEGDFEPDVPSFPEAVREVHGVWRRRRRAAQDAVRGEVPKLSRMLSTDAVLYLFLGLVATKTLEWWAGIFSASSEPVTKKELLRGLRETVVTAVEVLQTFPFAGDVFMFAVMAARFAGLWMFDHALAVGLTLLVGSFLIWLGDRRVSDDVDVRLFATRPRALAHVVGVVTATWVAGIITLVVAQSAHEATGGLLLGVVVYGVIATGGLLKAKKVRGSGDLARAIIVTFVSFAVGAAAGAAAFRMTATMWGSVMGLAMAGLVLVLLLRHEVRASVRRISRAHQQASDDGLGKRGTLAYIALRKALGALGLAAALVIPIFALTAVSEGKFRALLKVAIAESSAQVKVFVAFLAVTMLVFVIVQTRPAWGDLAAAIQHSLDRNGLRIALLSRGFPVLAVVMAVPFALAVPMLSDWQAVLAGVGVGVGLKVFLWLKRRATHAYSEVDNEPAKPGRVFIEGVVVEDASGQEIAVASLNGERVAAPVSRLDEFVDSLLEDVEHIFEEFTPSPSVYEYYYERIEDGVTDFERVEKEYRGHISKDIDTEVDKHSRDGIERERLEEKMAKKYDAEEVEKRLEKKRGQRDGVVIYDGKVYPA